MTETQNNTSNKKLLIFMSILGVAVMGAIAFVLTRPTQSLMVTDLYEYYPKNTAFFMEVAPGEKLSTRFLEGIDKLRGLDKSDTWGKDIKVQTLFQRDFEPAISIGIWTNTMQNANQKTQPSAKEVPFLVVLPVRKGVSLELLATDLKLPMNDYKQVKEGDATILQSKKGGDEPVMAFHNQHFLTAANMDTIKQALAEEKTPETLLDNPAYKNHLGLLPSDRQGTLLALTEEFQKFPQSAGPKDESLDRLMEFQKQLQAATPAMLGSITVDKDQYIQVNSFTPVDLAKVQNAEFRKDIKALYAQQAVFDLAKLLPKETLAYGGIVGLSSYYDMYVKHIATAKEKESLSAFESQLKMMGLDLRKNLISLLDGKAGIGLIGKQGAPDVLVFLNHNTDTEKAMDQLGMMAATMAHGRLSDKKMDESHTVKVLDTPGMPVKVAYSNVKPDTMVVGTQTAVEKMYTVQQKKSLPLTENALYKDLAGRMPEKASGVFFVDFAQTTALMDKWAPKTAKSAERDTVKQILGGIQGIAGYNTLENDNLMKGQVTIKLTNAQ